MIKICFSIPVHERLWVIQDQIRNICRFVRNPLIILHISPQFKSRFYEFPNDIQSLKLPCTAINPIQLPTMWGNLVHVHNSNFRFAKSVDSFDYFSMLSSNELFIQNGLEDYLFKKIAGVHQQPTNETMNWRERRMAGQDQDLLSAMRYLDLQQIYGSQIEGTFYETSLMQEVVDVIDRHYEFSLNKSQYCREEIFYPTVVAGLVRKENIYTPFTYSSVCKSPINRHLIKSFRNKTWVEDEYGNSGGETERYRLYDMQNIYAVKRIPRKYYDSLRRFIRI